MGEGRARGAPWLAGLVATSLLFLCGFTAVLRARITSEGYVLARCQDQIHGVDRRIRAVHAELLSRFASLDDHTTDAAPGDLPLR